MKLSFSLGSLKSLNMERDAFWQTESSLVPAKRESILLSDSASVNLSAPIRPAHSISDFNRRDFSWSAVPGSVYNLHIKF